MNKKAEFDIRLILLPPGYCNLHCTFCHQEGLSVIGSYCSGDFPDPCTFRDLIVRLQPRGLRGISVSGGEPLLKPDAFLPIIRELPSLPITVITNGTLLRRLIPIAIELGHFEWHVNVNMPSFDGMIYRHLTGQSRITPDTICSQINSMIRLGIEVNVNCVLCNGKNDNFYQIHSYVKTAQAYGLSSVRFLLKAEASDAYEHRLKNLLHLSREVGDRRGGLIRSYHTFNGYKIEIVRCEKSSAEDIFSGKSDVYITERQTVKLGLWGQETYYTNYPHLLTIILGYFKNKQDWVETHTSDSSILTEAFSS